MNWFLLETGSKPIIYDQDCSCRRNGRPYCYTCLAETNYDESEPKFNQRTGKPSWWFRRQKTHNTAADLRFLAGLLEYKPFRPYPKRRTQKPWQKMY